MTTRTASRVMRARHDSECPMCFAWIRPGQQIAKVHGIWLCIRCALNRLDGGQDGER
jgi:hypothetical protein